MNGGFPVADRPNVTSAICIYGGCILAARLRSNPQKCTCSQEDRRESPLVATVPVRTFRPTHPALPCKPSLSFAWRIQTILL